MLLINLLQKLYINIILVCKVTFTVIAIEETYVTNK